MGVLAIGCQSQTWGSPGVFLPNKEYFAICSFSFIEVTREAAPGGIFPSAKEMGTLLCLTPSNLALLSLLEKLLYSNILFSSRQEHCYREWVLQPCNMLCEQLSCWPSETFQAVTAMCRRTPFGPASACMLLLHPGMALMASGRACSHSMLQCLQNLLFCPL